MSSTIIATGLALFSALLFAAASAAQQSVAEEVPQEQATGLGLVRSLITQPRWWSGVLGDGGGYLAQAAALGFGSLLLVSPLMVVSLLFALPISAVLTGRRLTGRVVLLALALAVALAVFLVVGRPDEGVDSASARQWLAALVPMGLVAGGCAGLAKISSGSVRALLYGTTAGVLFGMSAPLTKSVIAIGSADLLALPSAWQTWALVATGVGGFYVQQFAFQSGDISASLPALTVAEPLVSALCGWVVFGERLRVHGAGWALIAACVAVMAGATVALARSQAESAAV